MAALQLPPLSGQRTPRPDPGVTCILKVGEIQAIHTHRVSSPPIAAVANANWNNARERERDSICTSVRQRGLAVASCDCERFLVFLSSGVYRKSDSKSVLQWECLERFFKGELRHTG